MKVAFACVLILCGILIGLYVGFWLMFIGGVVDIVAAIRADELDVAKLGWGIGKCLFAQFVGAVSAMVFCVPGAAILQDA